MFDLKSLNLANVSSTAVVTKAATGGSTKAATYNWQRSVETCLANVGQPINVYAVEFLTDTTGSLKSVETVLHAFQQARKKGKFADILNALQEGLASAMVIHTGKADGGGVYLRISQKPELATQRSETTAG